MKQSEAVGNLALALSKAQAAMSLAEKSAQNPHLKNKYADLTAVWNACKDALTTNGLAVSQLPSSRIDDNGIPIIGLSCILMHESGEWVSCFMESPAVGNRGVNDLQAAGSVITYLRRYTLSAIVGVSTGDDDDGSSVQNNPPPVQQKGKPNPAIIQPSEIRLSMRDDYEQHISPGPVVTKKSPANGGVTADQQKPTADMLKSLHAAGSSFYGSEWDAKRKELVLAITKGRSDSSKHLTREECQKLIDGIKEKADSNG